MGFRGKPIMLKLWNLFAAVVKRFNVWLGYVAALMIVASTAAISFEVVARYVFRQPHDWNLELNIFLLIGSTFLAAANTQMKRGHVGIEVLDGLLPPRWNRWRRLASDILSLLFCAFITVYIWKHFYQAWEGGWVSSSTWAPKEWIPYALMGLGMTMLSLQILLQIGDDLLRPTVAAGHEVLGE
jgi:TRAP-type C4-dicarboxylate transport system permease small subunit